MQAVFFVFALLISILSGAGSLLAQSAPSYPSRAIRLVIGFSPGTSLDASARIIGDELQKRWGQPVVLEFRPGANGSIAANYVATSAADGYTFFFGQWTTFHPVLLAQNAVDIGKAMTPVTRTASAPYVLAVSAKLPVASFQELVSYAKANPGKLTSGTSASSVRLLLKMIEQKTGLVARDVPYKGTSDAIIGMIAGDIGISGGAPQSFLSGYKAGQLRLLFVASAKRNPVFPDVPTAAEVGIPNFEIAVNHGIWAPKDTPRDIIDKLSAEVASVLAMPEVVNRFRGSFAMEAIGSRPEGLLSTYETEIKMWSDAARASNFKPE